MAHHPKHRNHHHADHHHDDMFFETQSEVMHEHHTVREELIHHIPYAIFSVAFCLVILSFVAFSTIGTDNPKLIKTGSNILFHSFHFMHIVFAATGTLITFLRFSKNWIKALIVGVGSPLIFCTLSDCILPYLGGTLLGVKMHFHLCFLSELPNIIPFLLVGMLNGFILSRHNSSRQAFYSVWSHFIHIFISALASSFYLVSHGFTTWYQQIGMVFLFLIVAVVIPCTLSDVVVPMGFARMGAQNERHKDRKS